MSKKKNSGHPVKKVYMFPDRINPELEQGTAQNTTDNEVRVDLFVRAVFVIVTK